MPQLKFKLHKTGRRTMESRLPITKSEIDSFLRDERQAQGKTAIESFKNTRRLIESRTSSAIVAKRESQIRDLYMQGLAFLANTNPSVNNQCDAYRIAINSKTPEALQMICDLALKAANMLDAVSTMPERLRPLHVQGLNETEFNIALTAMRTAFSAIVFQMTRSLSSAQPAKSQQEPSAASRKQKAPSKEPSLTMNFYEILGVATNADTNEIRKAYKIKAIQMHPDKHLNEEEKYKQLFQLLNQAQATLVDPLERAKYDRELMEQESLPSEQTPDKEPKAAFPSDSRSVGLMMFSASDGRLRCLNSVTDALEMISDFFNRTGYSRGTYVSVASNQADIEKQFERSAKDMHSNMYERGFGVAGEPLCVVEFSISHAEVKKLYDEIKNINDTSRRSSFITKPVEDRLELLLNKLACSINSLMISAKVINSTEESRHFEDHIVHNPFTGRQFLLFTRDELISLQIIPKPRQPEEKEVARSILSLDWLSSIFEKNNGDKTPGQVEIKELEAEKKEVKLNR
jgi:curved DNA-binding protein CbpA